MKKEFDIHPECVKVAMLDLTVKTVGQLNDDPITIPAGASNLVIQLKYKIRLVIGRHCVCITNTVDRFFALLKAHRPMVLTAECNA